MGDRDDDRDEWMTTEEVARHLHVSTRTVHDWRQTRNGPPAYRVGRRLLWRRAEVDAWVRDQVAAPAAEPAVAAAG
jgi:excisionase family DNA binding protein